MNQDSLKTLLLCLLSLVGMTAFAYDCEVNGICYNLNEDDHTASVTYKEQYQGDDYSGDIDIPETFDYSNETYTVTSIGEMAFYACRDLTSVKIPNSVESINNFSFRYCTGLTSIVIPRGVKDISSLAFDSCTAIETITVAEDNTVYDSRDNSNAIIKTANNELIYGCKNTYIPNSVTSIDNAAFTDCYGLTSITIPSSVVSIADRAFSGCSGLETIVVDEGNPNYDSRDNCNAIISKSDNGLIAGCKNSHIPDGVTSIHDFAFENCDAPASLVIPNSVTSIGYGAFLYCTSLRELTIGSGVTSIDDDAFFACRGLTSIVSLIEEPFAISDDVFKYVNATLHVPLNTKEAYLSADGWNSSFNDIREWLAIGEGNLSDDYVYSTFSTSVALDFTDNADVKAYTAKVNGETVELVPIDKVPANTGVIIERISESTSTIVSVADDVDALGDEDNALVAVTEKALTATDLVENNAYILVDDYQFMKVLPEAQGTLAIGKAYLKVPTTTNAASLAIGFGDDDGATGLTEKTAHDKDAPAAIYNLNGQRVTQPTKGLYIVNGKKVIIK